MTARPTVRAVWTGNYLGDPTAKFRVVMSATRDGTYYVEKARTDAAGVESWTEFETISLSADSRARSLMTSPIVAAMFDKIFGNV